MKNKNQIEFTPELFKRLKAEYTHATEHGYTSFTFEEKVWVTAYAKYVIEYK